MITIDVLINQTDGLSRADLDLWILNEWVKPDIVDGVLSFEEIDVARVILIRELRDDLEVNEMALPTVLSLIDQLYDLRRQLRHLDDVMHEVLPEEVRAKILQDVVVRAR